MTALAQQSYEINGDKVELMAESENQTVSFKAATANKTAGQIFQEFTTTDKTVGFDKDFASMLLPGILDIAKEGAIERVDCFDPNNGRLKSSEYLVAPLGDGTREPCVLAVQYDEKGAEKSWSGRLYALQLNQKMVKKILEVIKSRNCSQTAVRGGGKGTSHPARINYAYPEKKVVYVPLSRMIELGVDENPAGASMKCVSTTTSTVSVKTPVGDIYAKQTITVRASDNGTEHSLAYEGTIGGNKQSQSVAELLFHKLADKIQEVREAADPDYKEKFEAELTSRIAETILKKTQQAER
ncbi:MAG: hypothetical protein LBH81_03230 [Rickettsiales bacterium]|nr:hypothetical protein [Rickettsiales bacterium]